MVFSLKKMDGLYSLWMFPYGLSVASEAPLRTRKGCKQLLTSHDKKDHDNKTNVNLQFLHKLSCQLTRTAGILARLGCGARYIWGLAELRKVLYGFPNTRSRPGQALAGLGIKRAGSEKPGGKQSVHYIEAKLIENPD